MCLFQSVYPPKLSQGHPKRHHVVVYLHGRLAPEMTVETLKKQLKMDPDEVEACAWFDRTAVSSIVLAPEDSSQMTSTESRNTFRYEHIRTILCMG